VIAAVGNRVLLYNAENGDLLDSLRGHKDTVLCCDFSSDGTRFASGGLDSVVVFWKATGQGLLKYNHMGPIQRVLYHPNMLKLASCSDIDVGYWMPDQKQVTKEKVPAKVMSAAWSTDGTMLAVGLQNGVISIRNSALEEIVRMERKAPVMCMLFISVPVCK
jgi:intraflagellar transport protein 122